MKSGKCQREDSKSQNQRHGDRETPKPPFAAFDLSQARQAGSGLVHGLILARHVRTACPTPIEEPFDELDRMAGAGCVPSYLRRGLLDFVPSGEPIVQNIQVDGRNSEELAPYSAILAGPLNSGFDENCPTCVWER